MDFYIVKALRDALTLLRVGDIKAAQSILVEILNVDPNREQAWYMLSLTLQDKERQIYALQQALRLNPGNDKAQARLEMLLGEEVIKPPVKEDEPVGDISAWELSRDSFVETDGGFADVDFHTDDLDQEAIFSTQEGDEDLLSHRLESSLDVEDTFQPDDIIVPASPDLTDRETEERTEEEEDEKDRDEADAWDAASELRYGERVRPFGRFTLSIRGVIRFLMVVVILLGAFLIYQRWDTVRETVPVVVDFFQSVLISEDTPTPQPSPTSEPTFTGTPRIFPATWTPEPTSTYTNTPETFPSNTPAPTPTPITLSTEVHSEMELIRNQVVDIRGLRSQTEIGNFLLSPYTLYETLSGMFASEVDISQLEEESRILAAFDLVGPGYDTENYFLDRKLDRVGGFYLPEENEIYVIGLTFNGIQKYIYANEYNRTLLYENFDISNKVAELDCEVNSQPCQAFYSLIEGDGLILSDLWAEENTEGQVYSSISSYAPQTQYLGEHNPPPFVEIDLGLGYIFGRAFVEYQFNDGGWWAVNALYRDPPATTEQILHPEKYDDREGSVEVDFKSPKDILGGSWRVLINDSLGEWKTYLVLGYGFEVAGEIPDDVAASAAEGWGGDQYEVFVNDESGETVLFVHWVFDSIEEAEDFLNGMNTYQDIRFNGLISSEFTKRCWQSSTEYSCILTSGEEVLWLLTPDSENMGNLLIYYSDFE
jgi:hypothetical protein